MLTKEQIDAARSASVCWPAAKEALDAYERVKALVENLRTMAVLSIEEHDHNMRVADMIDRALEG